jgi:hypothetical protein
MEHDLFDYVFFGIFCLPILTACICFLWFTWRLFKE